MGTWKLSFSLGRANTVILSSVDQNTSGISSTFNILLFLSIFMLLFKDLLAMTILRAKIVTLSPERSGVLVLRYVPPGTDVNLVASGAPHHLEIASFMR